MTTFVFTLQAYIIRFPLRRDEWRIDFAPESTHPAH